MKVDIALFRYRDSPGEPMDSIHNATGRLVQAGADVRFLTYGGALIHSQRNMALSLRRPDVDYFIMIDDDMLLEPDTHLKLIAHQAPVASPVCTTRKPPIVPCLNVWNPELGCFGKVEWIEQGKAWSDYFAVGAACACISGAMIDRLVEMYLSGEDWVHQNSAMLDRMEVSQSRRRKEQNRISGLRRNHYANDKGTARVFDFDVLDSQEQIGEDISALGYRLKWLDQPTIIDTGIQVLHQGTYGYGLKDVARPTAEKKAA